MMSTRNGRSWYEDEEKEIIESLTIETEQQQPQQRIRLGSYSTDRVAKTIWLCTAISLFIIMITFVTLLISSKIYENKHKTNNDNKMLLTKLNRHGNHEIDDGNAANCDDDWSSQSFGRNRYGNSESKDQRSRYKPNKIGHINIFIRQPTEDGRHRVSQRFRFPAARYTLRTFPLLGPFTSFQVTQRIFLHSLSAQTVIYAPNKDIYVLPPLFNKHDQIFSVAELIALGYARLEKKICGKLSSTNVTGLFRPESVLGPRIPKFNSTTNRFRGGIEVNYRWPFISTFSNIPTYINITYNNDDRYEGYLSNGMLNGHGTYYYADGRKYVGNFINGSSNGYGQMFWADHTRYEGHWRDDMMHENGTYYYADGRKYIGHSIQDTADGYGEMFWPGGDHYLGYWKNDSMHGNGTYDYADGKKFIGHYINSIKDGLGEMFWKNGDHYIGYWRNDSMHGNGTYYYSDGKKYVGHLVDNNFDGYGTMQWIDDARYIGGWKNDMMNGNGTYYYADGRKYVGESVNDTFNGYGAMVWPGGARYEGGWRFDKMNGNGTYYYADGGKYIGHFVNDTKDGYGEMHWPDNSWYQGHWKNDMMHGNGTYNYTDGRKYVGHSINNTADGYGEMFWPEGDHFLGYWKDDNKQGLGKFIFANGTIQDGTWKDDIFMN
ncbi:hypothetical protein I4U23_003692 [Adineta vaga]|nr:hypothetical protein I4U23_003692 [Adineta vaga]